MRHLIRFLVDLTFGQPDHLIAKALEIEVPAAIVLEGLFFAVVDVAVGFDDQSSISPEEVDEIRADWDIDFRRRQSVVTAQFQEVELQIAAGSVIPRPIADCALIADWQPEDARLPDGSTQFIRWHSSPPPLRCSSTQIGNRPHRRRGRDPVAKGHVSWDEHVGAMYANAAAIRSAAVPLDDDVGWVIPGRKVRTPFSPIPTPHS